MRKRESDLLREVFANTLGMTIHMVDAEERFLGALSGVVDPEEKRKIIGREFIRVFEEESTKLGEFKFLAQGTLYPDVIESTSKETKAAQKIKTHHNVGGLPGWSPAWPPRVCCAATAVPRAGPCDPYSW
jgi:GMP synthase (glutamine-hydrolysing)